MKNEAIVGGAISGAIINELDRGVVHHSHFPNTKVVDISDGGPFAILCGSSPFAGPLRGDRRVVRDDGLWFHKLCTSCLSCGDLSAVHLIVARTSDHQKSGCGGIIVSIGINDPSVHLSDHKSSE
jgi:hypothetical protein